jgi:hypothetical protein
LKYLIAYIVILTGFFFTTSTSSAQITASASASARIITPIALEKVDDMYFGNISVNSSGGTVLLPPVPNPTRTPGGGVTLPTNTGPVKAAKFSVSGAPGFIYYILLPSSNVVQRNGGTETMILDEFTCSPSPTGTMDENGLARLFVGGTLHVNGTQAPGLYLSAIPFNITINYQ